MYTHFSILNQNIIKPQYYNMTIAYVYLYSMCEVSISLNIGQVIHIPCKLVGFSVQNLLYEYVRM